MAPVLERCFSVIFEAHKLNIIQHSKNRRPPLDVCSVKICCTAVLLCCCTADVLYSVRSPAALRLRSGGPVVARAGPRDKVPRHDVVPAVRTSPAALVDARNVAPAHCANVVFLPSEPHHLREARCWWASGRGRGDWEAVATGRDGRSGLTNRGEPPREPPEGEAPPAAGGAGGAARAATASRAARAAAAKRAARA